MCRGTPSGMKMGLRAVRFPKVQLGGGVITKSVLKSGRICVMTPGPPRAITQQKMNSDSLESKLSDDSEFIFCW